MHDPDVITLIRPHADGVAEHPVIRQRFGPREVDLEAGRLHRAARLRRHAALDSRLGHAERDHHSEKHDTGEALRSSHRVVPLLSNGRIINVSQTSRR
jgi:hypothetical protein